jgi:cytochrome c
MIRNLTLVTALLAAPIAYADSDGPSGDPAAGEAAFRSCIACHVVRNDEGEVLAGRNGRTGPNLFGLPGRAAGSFEGFRYSPAMIAGAEAGLVWNEDTFVEYVPNATEFLREFSGQDGVRSSMSPQRASEEDIANIWALLVSLSPMMMMEDGEMMDEEDMMDEEASE